MTEDEARSWIDARHGRDATERLEAFEAIFRAEAERQNLVSPASLTSLWSRHFVDSAQLLGLAGARGGIWIDVGTGAGFPGLIVALLRAEPIRLVEPRGLRAAFLREVSETLKLPWVEVLPTKVEAVRGTADIVSARAVANVPALLKITSHLRVPQTVLLFPRGRQGQAELESLPAKWQRLFHVEQSVTDPASLILVSSGAR